MVRRRPTLIAVSAFNRDGEGRLKPAFAPKAQSSPQRAIWLARALMRKHDGVIAWRRERDPVLGDYGQPTTLFMHGEVPKMY